MFSETLVRVSSTELAGTIPRQSNTMVENIEEIVPENNTCMLPSSSSRAMITVRSTVYAPPSPPPTEYVRSDPLRILKAAPQHLANLRAVSSCSPNQVVRDFVREIATSNRQGPPGALWTVVLSPTAGERVRIHCTRWAKPACRLKTFDKVGSLREGAHAGHPPEKRFRARHHLIFDLLLRFRRVHRPCSC